MRTLFVTAWLARIALTFLAIHWGIIGSLWLLGRPTEWASDYTPILVLFGSLSIASIVIVFRLDPRVQERMKAGPADLLRYSMPILVVAAISNIGGLALYVQGDEATAIWAMGLSAVVLICEITAFAGSLYLKALQSTDEDPSG